MSRLPKIASLPLSQGVSRSRSWALKSFLVLTAFSAVAAVVTWPYVRAKIYYKPTPAFNLQDDNQANAAISPTYQGRDQEGQLYVIKADKGEEISPQYYKLVNPSLVYHLNSGQEIQISAQQGFYEPQERKVSLVDEVRVKHSSGYDFVTSKALIDIEHVTISGDNLVSGKSPTGNLEGSGFQVLDRGNRIIVGKPTLRHRG